MSQKKIKYRSLNSYLKQRYGEKVYKLSISCSNSCPNRDGTCGKGGCVFCAEGSGSFAGAYGTPIDKQIDKAKALISKKSDCKRFIAYFQSFTSTYGELEYIEKCLQAAAARPEIVAISVATRPDCLGEDALEMLKRIDSKKPVTVELGLQSIHERTADFINRGYKLPVYDACVKKLKSAGLETVVHLILGLPWETEEMMLQTVEYVVKSGADGIKLQLLHILEDTPLAEKYKRGEIATLEFSQYIELLKKCVALIPESVVIHRLTGDGDKRKLLAPLWSANKRVVLNEISKHFEPI